MIRSSQTDGRFSLVEHPIKPRAPAAPLHTHSNEDEYSYVLEGEVGVQIGERVQFHLEMDLESIRLLVAEHGLEM
jgi:mannose-6-phosphate isomerase-like protein (cupin superfamily)